MVVRAQVPIHTRPLATPRRSNFFGRSCPFVSRGNQSSILPSGLLTTSRASRRTRWRLVSPQSPSRPSLDVEFTSLVWLWLDINTCILSLTEEVKHWNESSTNTARIRRVRRRWRGPRARTRRVSALPCVPWRKDGCRIASCAQESDPSCVVGWNPALEVRKANRTTSWISCVNCVACPWR